MERKKMDKISNITGKTPNIQVYFKDTLHVVLLVKL